MYYAAIEHTNDHNALRGISHQDHTDHSVHARHCFDYLRQSLLCLADTNLEPYNYTLDGVTGWGRKTCRDSDAVFVFSNEWGGGKYASDYEDD